MFQHLAKWIALAHCIGRKPQEPRYTPSHSENTRMLQGIIFGAQHWMSSRKPCTPSFMSATLVLEDHLKHVRKFGKKHNPKIGFRRTVGQTQVHRQTKRSTALSRSDASTSIPSSAQAEGHAQHPRQTRGPNPKEPKEPSLGLLRVGMFISILPLQTRVWFKSTGMTTPGFAPKGKALDNREVGRRHMWKFLS